MINFDELLAEDLALKEFIDEQLGDLLNPGIYFLPSPFAAVGTLFRKPDALMLDMFDNPQFVHALCRYALDTVKEVAKRVTAKDDCVLLLFSFAAMLSPAQFKEFALPYMEEFVAEFPGLPIMIGSGGDIAHVLDMLFSSSIPFILCDSGTDVHLLVETAKKYNKPFTLAFPLSVLMSGDRKQIRAKNRELLEAAKEVHFYYLSDGILGGDVSNTAIDFLIEAYRDDARFPIDFSEEIASSDAAKVEAGIDPSEVVWEKDGEEALRTEVPIFVRKMVRKKLTALAAQKGITRITGEMVRQAKKEAGF